MSTYARRRQDGLVEIVVAHTGAVLQIIPDTRDYLATPDAVGSPLIKYPLPDGTHIYVHKDITLDAVMKRPRIPYSQVIVDLICQQLLEGKKLKEITKMPGFPDYTTLFQWRKQHTHIDEMFEQAKRDRAEHYHDLAIERAEKAAELANADQTIQAEKLAVDTYKWAAEKGDPGRYGNRTKVEGTLGVAMQLIVDTGIRRSEDGRVVGTIDTESAHNISAGATQLAVGAGDVVHKTEDSVAGPDRNNSGDTHTGEPGPTQGT